MTCLSVIPMQQVSHETQESFQHEPPGTRLVLKRKSRARSISRLIAHLWFTLCSDMAAGRLESARVSKLNKTMTRALVTRPMKGMQTWRRRHVSRIQHRFVSFLEGGTSKTFVVRTPLHEALHALSSCPAVLEATVSL